MRDVPTSITKCSRCRPSTCCRSGGSGPRPCAPGCWSCQARGRRWPRRTVFRRPATRSPGTRRRHPTEAKALIARAAVAIKSGGKTGDEATIGALVRGAVAIGSGGKTGDGTRDETPRTAISHESNGSYGQAQTSVRRRRHLSARGQARLCRQPPTPPHCSRMGRPRDSLRVCAHVSAARSRRPRRGEPSAGTTPSPVHRLRNARLAAAPWIRRRHRWPLASRGNSPRP